MGKWEDTSHVTRTTVAYGSRNQNKDCSCGKRLRNLASVVNMNSADSFSTYTGLRVLLFKIAFSKGRRSSNAPFTLGHKLLTSSTENQSERIKYDKILIKKKENFDIYLLDKALRTPKLQTESKILYKSLTDMFREFEMHISESNRKHKYKSCFLSLVNQK